MLLSGLGMRILLIEDNPLKREKISEFIDTFDEVQLSEAASYNSGMNYLLAESFDLLILDMSMPTFDRTDASHGGRFRAVGGKEIAIRLSKLDRLVPFVVVSGYKDFSVGSQSLSIEQIDDSLRHIGSKYLGCIIFEAADSVWKEQLTEIIGRRNL